MNTENGKSKLELFFDDEWPRHRRESTDAMRKIDEMHSSIAAIRNDTKHLLRLDTIAETLTDLKDTLIEVVSGKNVVDVDTVKGMMKAQQDSYTTAISIMCKVFCVIFVVLLGLKLLAPHVFGN